MARYSFRLIKSNSKISSIFLVFTLYTLVFWATVAPNEARANILASIFGTRAGAAFEELTSALTTETLKNSQTMGLLEANSYSFLALNDKPAKTEVKSKKEAESEPELNQVDPESSVYISENALVPSVGPLGSGEVAEVLNFEDDVPSVYVVKKGDTLAEVADMFGVTTDTILSFNDMKKGDKLAPEMVLLIPSYSGVDHTVKKGDNLQGIAKLYGISVDELVLWNHLEGSKIVIGDKLFIPGGELKDEPKAPTKKPSSNIAKNPTFAPQAQISVGTGYFMNPLPGGKYVRGLSSRHKGVDLGAPTGTSLYAAASGRVSIARSGWNGGYGTMVIITHDNGTRTLYAHMSKLSVSTGQYVEKGQVIGAVGSTGRSTGPHLHFEVYGAKNFLDR